MEFQSINTGRNIANNLNDLIKGDVVFNKKADWMKDLSIDQLDKAFAVLPQGHAMKDQIAEEIEKRLDGEEAVIHKAEGEEYTKEQLKEMIAEHKRLIERMKSSTKEDDKKEVAIQEKELAGYEAALKKLK